MLKLTLKRWYSRRELKDKLREYYQINQINKTPKATDILEFYEVKDMQQRIKGKQTNGFLILNNK